MAELGMAETGAGKGEGSVVLLDGRPAPAAGTAGPNFNGAFLSIVNTISCIFPTVIAVATSCSNKAKLSASSPSSVDTSISTRKDRQTKFVTLTKTDEQSENETARS